MSCEGAHNEVETVSDPMPTAGSINSDALLMEKVSGMPARECMSLYLQPMYGGAMFEEEHSLEDY